MVNKMRLFSNSFLVLMAWWTATAYATPPEKVPVRHDWKQTFKKPYFVEDTIPYFEYFENTLPSVDFIRLSPSLKGMKGAIWAKEPNPHKEWIVEFSVNVFGRHLHGGDGMAFWYTKDRGQMGPVYGSKDSWEGLMVALDTYDKRDLRTNTFVLGMLNHNNLEYSKVEHPMSYILSGCFREYRNLKAPLKVRVTYANRTINIDVDNINEGGNYQPCFESENVDLPTGYYFGMSAASSHDEGN
ncbi:legume-like lectin [Syncephalis fuscata]|nr:legume-like lectin [Syncephalis fuscata]